VTFQVKEIQPTPNPNALKFILSVRVAEHPISFRSSEDASGLTPASQLMAIPGVVGLLFLNDFVTVNKLPAARWPEIRPRAKKILESTEIEVFHRYFSGLSKP
jgi:NFU1 iron-sulfur cluster scaffold homolog, mitochondrial